MDDQGEPQSGGDTAAGFEVVWVQEGVGVRRSLADVAEVAFERVAPVREFPSYRGQRNFPGLYWAARIELVAYPEAVVLTGLFASPHWRNHPQLPAEAAKRLNIAPISFRCTRWSSPRSGRGGDLTPCLSVSIVIMGDMTNPNLTTGSIWRLHHGDQEIARLAVTGADWPWTHADVETLPGFEEFRPLFSEQERAVDEEDWEQIDECYFRIRSALTLTFPDGNPVAEFMLHIHDDGTAGWRWHDEPFDAVNP